MTSREELIEKARVAFTEAWDEENRKEWAPPLDYHRRSRAGIVAALAVFEEAQTPTDDEREDEHQAQMIAFETAKLEARNSMRHDPHVWHEALEDALDKVLPAVWHAAAGFRHTVQGEPTWPQGEPSDAQIEAALQALGHARSGVTTPVMRAALRAAVEAERGRRAVIDVETQVDLKKMFPEPVNPEKPEDTV